jgi:hypothetical protein
MNLGIAMLLAYLPFFYWVYTEIRDGGKIDPRQPPQQKITVDKDDAL